MPNQNLDDAEIAAVPQVLPLGRREPARDGGEEMRRAPLLVAIALTSAPAFGCGYCDEDKIAAVYDHGLVVKTLAHGHDVAFIAYDLRAPIGGESSDAIRFALERIGGIDRGSVRVASESFSLAFDPRPVAGGQAAACARSRARSARRS